MNAKFIKLISALLLITFGLTMINPDFVKADPNVLPFPYTLEASNVSATSVTFNGKISTTQGTDGMMAYFKYFETGSRTEIQKTWNR